MSDPQRPHGLQPTRLLHPWDFSRQEYWSGVPLPSPIDLLVYVLALELDFVWIISFLPPSTTNPSVSPPKYTLNLFTLLPSLLPLSLIQTTITSCQDESTSPSWSHIQSCLLQLISAQRPEGPFQNVNQFFVFFPCLWPNPQTVQFSSVAQSCPTLCDPMDCSTPGLPVHHQLPEFTQTHVHRVGDAIQPSHPLLFPSPPAFNLFQHQGLFK